MEPSRKDDEESLYDLLLMARNYRPNGNKDYFVPIDAAMGAVLGSPLIADRLLGLALKTRCILNFKEDKYYTPQMELVRDGKTVSWTYSVRRRAYEGRQVAWVPSQECGASSGWGLTLIDYDYGASVVSKDLMWLMLQCHKISGLVKNPPPTYSRAIMEYFTVSEVKDYIDPLGVLPGHAGQWEIYGGIASLLKGKRYSIDAPNMIAAAISNDSWWELYLRSLKKAGHGSGLMGAVDGWYTAILSLISKEHELRVLDLVEAMGVYRGLAQGCVYRTKGPLLRAALERPDQKCTINSYMLATILFREDIDRECASALIAYLRRCEKTELTRAIRDFLMSLEGRVHVCRLSPGAARVLIQASSGLEITPRAYEYMNNLYISSLLHSSLSPCGILPDFVDTLSRTRKEVAEELSLAAETLYAAEFYATLEDATTAVTANLLVLCPDDQKELSRVLLRMMLRGAEGRDMLAAYVGHVSTIKRIRKAETNKCTMDLFGLRFRPWLSGKERIVES